MAAIRYLLTIAAAVVLAAGPALAEADDDCRVTQQAFSECVSYIIGMDASVQPRCCIALASFRGMGATAPQRRALCQCILSELHSAGTVVSERAAALESACKVPVGFIPTSSSFDCSA
jgi:hypothetical protein